MLVYAADRDAKISGLAKQERAITGMPASWCWGSSLTVQQMAVSLKFQEDPWNEDTELECLCFIYSVTYSLIERWTGLYRFGLLIGMFAVRLWCGTETQCASLMLYCRMLIGRSLAVISQCLPKLWVTLLGLRTEHLRNLSCLQPP